jgi:general stress protein YciG
MENHDNNGDSNGDSTLAKTPRGFATWSKERQREAASKGGKIAHASGKAHKFSSVEAKEAGRRGGLAIAAKKRQMKAERRVDDDRLIMMAAEATEYPPKSPNDGGSSRQ